MEEARKIKSITRWKDLGWNVEFYDKPNWYINTHEIAYSKLHDELAVYKYLTNRKEPT